MLLYDSVNDDYEGSCRTTYLHPASSKQRDDESSDDSGDEAFSGPHARGNTKGYRQWQRHNSNNNSGHSVSRKLLLAITFQAS